MITCTPKKYDNPHIVIETNFGSIELELYPKQAPKTVAAFLSHVNAGFYNNANFYRVLKNDYLLPDNNYGLIQGGVYPNIKNVPAIPHEPTSTTNIKHLDGTISMASQGAGTATTEFFICIGEQFSYNAGSKGTADRQGYAAFGAVVKGMSVVRSIQAEKNVADIFLKKIKIITIKAL